LKKLLFITHDASRTGAPLVLLHLLKWLKRNVEHIQLDILFVNSGALEQDFKSLCREVYFVPEIKESPKYLKGVYQKVLNKFGKKINNNVDVFFKRIAKNNYNLIYANTVVSVAYGSRLKGDLPQAKLLLHVHEMNTIITTMAPDFNNYIHSVDFFIAASKPVKTNLIINWAIETNKVEVIYAFTNQKTNNLKKSNSVFTVGASGLSHWRKGNDVFLLVAHYIKTHYPKAKIRFVWVGDEGRDKAMINADIEKLGLEEIVHFIGEKEHPQEEYKNFDIFLLTSREDPFPLVCIEVANLKKPIICFEHASGTAEVINKGGGFVVPYLDIECMSEKIMLYYKNPKKMEEDGKMAKELFSDFTPENICPLIYEKINALL